MRRAIQVGLGFALLLLLIAGAVSVVAAIARWFDGLPQDTSVAVVGATAVVTVPIVTYMTNRTLERRRAVEAATRTKRVELYEEFFSFFGRLFTPERLSSRPSEGEMAEFLVMMTPRMMAHASNNVVKRWGRFRIAAADGALKPGDPTIMYQWEDLMKAMRTDLGHSGIGLQRHDLLRLFINDIDSFRASG